MSTPPPPPSTPTPPGPASSPSGARLWVAGARPRTLPLSVGSVVVGVGAAWAEGIPSWWRAVLALVVGVALQIGVNYANDYSDGIRGTDANRVGPLRLVASGLVPPARVKLAAMTAFGVGCVAGLVLAASTSWWLILIGAFAVAGAWYYTGGRHPYGYAGLGDVSVFLFFGPVAVIGTAYVATDPARVTWLAIVCAIPAGLLTVAVLVANNLRDVPTDAESGKRTLAVRIGEPATRGLYVGSVLIGLAATCAVAVWRPWALIALLAGALAVPPLRRVLAGARGRDLIPVLVATSRLQLVYSVLLASGLAF